MSEVIRMGEPETPEEVLARGGVTIGIGKVEDTSIKGDARKKFSHYHKDVSGLDFIDVYRVFLLYQVTDPCIQHAVKKLLVAGGRGAKDLDKDIAEAIVTLQRWQEIRREDAARNFNP